MKAKTVLNIYDLYWTPEGRKIGRVQAKDASSARRKAGKPYTNYLGEIGVELVDPSKDAAS